jgi:hypothetical protein
MGFALVGLAAGSEFDGKLSAVLRRQCPLTCKMLQMVPGQKWTKPSRLSA